jgi:hypothetical protein
MNSKLNGSIFSFMLFMGFMVFMVFILSSGPQRLLEARRWLMRARRWLTVACGGLMVACRGSRKYPQNLIFVSISWISPCFLFLLMIRIPTSFQIGQSHI